MAEIIGLTASLITLAGVGAKLASTLHSAASTLTSSSHEARLIAADISLFSNSLIQLSKTLPMVAPSAYAAPHAAKLLEITEVLVLACSSLVDELQRYVGDPVVLRMRGRGAVWRRAVGWHFRWFLQRGKVGFVRGLVESFKATLVFLVATMDLAVGVEQGAGQGVRESLKMQVETNMRFAEDAKANLLQCREVKEEDEVSALADDLGLIETSEVACKESVPMLKIPARSLVPYEQRNSLLGQDFDLHRFNHEDDVLQVACLDECSKELVGILKVQEDTLEVAEALLKPSPAPTFTWGSPREGQTPRNRPLDGISLDREAASGKIVRGESSEKTPSQPTAGLDSLQSLDAEESFSVQKLGGGSDYDQDIRRMIKMVVSETLSARRHRSSADSAVKSQDPLDSVESVTPPSGTVPSPDPARETNHAPLSKSNSGHRKTQIQLLADEDGSERLTRLERTLLAERDELTRQNAVKAEQDIATRILEATNAAREEAERRAKAAEELREKTLAEEEEEIKKTKENAEWERFLERQKAEMSIKLNDPLGRQHSFPWERVTTWEGMEIMIEQQLGHHYIIGSRVKKGQYVLVGTQGGTLSRENWYDVVKPGMEVTLQMRSRPESAPETVLPEEKESTENEAAAKGPRFKALGRFFGRRAINVDSRES